MLRVMHHQEPEYLPIRTDMQVGMSSILLDAPFLSESNPVGYDWFGRKWIYEPEIRAACVDVNEPLIEDITQWKDLLKFPDLSKLDWEAAAAKDTASWDRENKLVRFIIGAGPWENLYYSMNFADALCALMEEPEACKEFFEAVMDYKIQEAEYVIRYYKPDIITLHEDYGSATGLFMSPDVWRELLKPGLKRFSTFCRENGVIYQHHNCGYMASIVEEMINDCGVEAWQLVHIVNNPGELYRKFGNCLAMEDGLVDTIRIDSVNTTEAEIRRLVREAADAVCPGGAAAVISASTVRKFPERMQMVDDELIAYAQKYYRNRRPE